MTAKERVANKAPSNEVSWVKKALLVFWLGIFFWFRCYLPRVREKFNWTLFTRILCLMKKIFWFQKEILPALWV